MRRLRLGDDLSLPLEAVTETFGILAMRGAGKSNTAAVMAEEMFRAGLAFVVIDPVGSWWGLRSSRDGKGAGLEIPIFGGRHGDVPLERGGGSLVADLVAEERLSCVLDLDGFDSEASKKTFLLDFARRLYQKNRDPLHLFLEESDDYIPQKPMRDEAQLLRAWENIVRRGRNRGLGITLITQRSAVLNKNVLTQIGTLVVLRTTSPQDRKAIGGWVEYHGQSPELLESLPGLKDGEAWVWSPHFLKKLVRTQIRLRETYDSAATPKVAQASRAPATLADVDLGAIQKRMSATIERAKQEDPRELRRQVASLQQQLAQSSKLVPLPMKVRTETRKVVVPVLGKRDQKRLERLVESSAAVGSYLVWLQDAVKALRGGLDEFRTGITTLVGAVAERGREKAPLAPAKVSLERPIRGKEPAYSPTVRPRLDAGDRKLSDYARQILETIAQRHPMRLTRSQIATLSGRSPRSSAFTAAMAALLRLELIGVEGGQYGLTVAGHAEAGGTLPAPKSSAEVRQMWLQILPAYERSLLEVLLDAGPKWVSRQGLADAAGRSIISSAFAAGISTLVKNKLAEIQTGEVRASETLFLEAR